MGQKKRQLRASLLIVTALFVYMTWCVGAEAASPESLSNEDFIRFHVVANSNSPEDQALKLKVRDGLLEVIQAGLEKESGSRSKEAENGDLTALTAKDAETYILNHLPEIEAAAGTIIAREGYEYPVSAELGIRFIPAKTYGKVTFPAGNYKALTVTIGEGKGENWWCVLFPPLCLIDGEDPFGMDDKYEPLRSAEKPVTLKLRFKTLELLDH